MGGNTQTVGSSLASGPQSVPAPSKLVASVYNAPMSAGLQQILTWVNNTGSVARILVVGQANVISTLTGGSMFTISAGDGGGITIFPANSGSGLRSFTSQVQYVLPGATFQVTQNAVSVGSATVNLEFWQLF